MSNQHFEMADGTLAPQPWMQYRRLTFSEVESVAATYAPSGGGAKNVFVHRVDTQWTNTTPVPQWVYGMVTRGGHEVALQARSRAYLSTWQGCLVRNVPDVPAAWTLIESGRSGGGMSIGMGGVLSAGTKFGVHRVYKEAKSAPLQPWIPEMKRVDPGQTIMARVELRFVSEFWENTAIDRGASGAESSFSSGDTRIDLYGIPVVDVPPVRSSPTIIGEAHASVPYLTTHIDPAVPTGTEEGDVIVAAVLSNFYKVDGVDPVQAGWTLLTSRHDGTVGLGAVGLRLYARVAGDEEPGSYRFNLKWVDAAVEEVSAQTITIRDASTDFESGWQIGSAIRRRFWDKTIGNICPNVDGAGGLLLCSSYLSHTDDLAPIHQTRPLGTTPVGDVIGTTSSLSTVSLVDPPVPTGEKLFIPSKDPDAPMSLAWSILVAGEAPVW